MKRSILILIACLSVLLVYADVQLTLLTGQVVTGTVVFENDEVVVLKDAIGQRYQFPVSEIKSRREVEEAKEVPPIEAQVSRAKKVGVNVQLSVGAGYNTAQKAGTAVNAALYVGACNAFQKQIFIGGGIGYDVYAMAQNYHFLPLTLRVEVPLMQTKHAPALGASIGYNVSLQKGFVGGCAADLDLGWRCRVSNTTATFLGVTAAIRQAEALAEEQLNGKTYTEKKMLPFGKVAVKMALSF